MGQQRLDDRFWKQTWPTLKANGWSVDARDGAFYPPQAQKMHAAKRRRLGSEHKNCFKNIHELTYIYHRIQFFTSVKVNLLPYLKAQAKASLPNHTAKLNNRLMLTWPKCATRRTGSAWRKIKMHRQSTI